MGITDSPYRYIQLLIHIEFISYRERDCLLNHFQWGHTKLNLTGEKFYIPKLPWVIKVRSDGLLSSEFFIYEYGGRII